MHHLPPQTGPAFLCAPYSRFPWPCHGSLLRLSLNRNRRCISIPLPHAGVSSNVARSRIEHGSTLGNSVGLALVCQPGLDGGLGLENEAGKFSAIGQGINFSFFFVPQAADHF